MPSSVFPAVSWGWARGLRGGVVSGGNCSDKNTPISTRTSSGWSKPRLGRGMGCSGLLPGRLPKLAGFGAGVGLGSC